MQFSSKVVALSLVSALYLAGCSEEPAAESPTPGVSAPAQGEAETAQSLIHIRGSLAYQARGTLQPNSHAKVEVIRPSEDQNAEPEVLASERIDLIGREAPIAFEINLNLDGVEDRDGLQLHAHIVESNRPAWTTDPVALTELSEEHLNVGELTLLPLRSAAFASILHCGRLQVSAGYHNEDLVLKAAGKDYILLPTESASGARFEAEGDASTRFWSRGETALLTLEGVSYPECVQPGALPKPFIAIGHEPSWHVRLEPGLISVNRGEEKVLQSHEFSIVEDNNKGRTLQAGEDDRVKLHTLREVCYDSMSGMPYPHSVSLTIDGETFEGCGGDPRRLLQGTEWVVSAINDASPADGSRLVLNFQQSDRLSGFASCNNLSAEYKLDGESLTIAPPSTTRKACGSAIMQQEQQFMDILQRVQRFAFTEEGALVLHTNEMETITAKMD